MRCVEMVFSPTGGCQKVADILAGALASESRAVDLSDCRAAFGEVELSEDEFALVAMPCFGGRAPQAAITRLKMIAGGGAKCVCVNVYGNRAFDDALLEMSDAAQEAGFAVVAAVAAVAEHSIMRQYAAGRPDADDIAELQQIAERIKPALEGPAPADAPAVPGNRPYLKAGAVPLVPQVKGACTACGTCAQRCPVAAISLEDYSASKGGCIACMRCTAECPAHARKVNGLMVKAAGLAIKKAASSHKGNELFM